MLDSVNLIIYGAAVSAISFFAVLFMTPAAIRSLTAKRKVVPDAHKPEKPQVPRPAGLVIMISIAAAEIVLFFLTMNIAVFAILLTTAIAFLVGYIDDSRREMPGCVKPVALLAAAIPLVVLDIYGVGEVHGDSLNLIFGRAYIPLLYIPLILIIIPITGNTINSIDVLNGVASGFLIIATIPLLASIAIFGSREVFLAALPILFATIAFYRYHKFPSRIFPGDSGTLLLGAMYGAVAIAGSSATNDTAAPATLVRLIVVDRPLGEREIGYQIFKLALFTSLLAFVSIAIQYFFINR